jgi:predicted anti-sigma-YlaC factor YlaD
MLSTFEAALLDRHLDRCESCRGFDAGLAEQTRILRGRLLEPPAHPVVIPAPARRRVARAAVGAAGSLVAAAAAAAVLVLPGSGDENGRHSARATGSPVLVAFAATPTPSAKVDVPRLKLQPASIADGPVHGEYNTPAAI